MIDRLRRLLRHMGVGERRWIAEPVERHRHTALVRSRLPGGVASRDDPAPEGDELAGADATDSVITRG